MTFFFNSDPDNIKKPADNFRTIVNKKKFNISEVSVFCGYFLSTLSSILTMQGAKKRAIKSVFKTVEKLKMAIFKKPFII